MEKKILYINPVRDDDPQEMATLTGVADAQTQLEYRSLGTGPKHLQYKSYRAAILMQLVSTIKQAENEGFDAVIVGCFPDPGLGEGREITANTLVVGPGEASILIAATLGVPVIDPGIAAVKFAEFLVEIKTRFGWKHSKIGAYETPPKEEILRWQLEGASLWQ